MSTGPEATLHEAERTEAYTLIAEREALKAELYGPLVRLAGRPSVTDPSSVLSTPARLARLTELRARLADIMTSWTDTGYVYHDLCQSSM
jgi:hypothetical protein